MKKTKLPLQITGKSLGISMPIFRDQINKGDLKFLLERRDKLKKRSRLVFLLMDNLNKISKILPKKGYIVGLLESTDIRGDTIINITDYCKTKQETLELFRDYTHQGKIASYIRLPT